jgi:hypothetical protein
MKTIYFCFFLLLIPSSFAEILTRNLTVTSNKIDIIQNYSSEDETGLIQIQVCSTCPIRKFNLTPESILILNAKDIPIENLQRTKLTSPSQAVRIQYVHESDNITYIRWNPAAEY